MAEYNVAKMFGQLIMHSLWLFAYLAAAGYLVYSLFQADRDGATFAMVALLLLNNE